MPTVHDSSSPLAEAAMLRRRAADLRRFSFRLQQLQVLTVHQRADEHTWVGASATRCVDDLRHMRRLLLAHADDLAAVARRFEQQAAALAALVAVPVPDPRRVR
jgi:hypothetical protein